MKVVVFLRNDFLSPIAYGAGEIAGFPDEIADRLIARGFAKLHGDGRPKQAGGKIPGAKDHMSPVDLEEHVEKLKKEGWKPPPPIGPVVDAEIQRAARERAFNELNQIR